MSQNGCYLLLSWFNQHNVINIVGLCDAFVEETDNQDLFEINQDTEVEC